MKNPGFIACFVSISMIACSDSISATHVPSVVLKSLKSKFPETLKIEWARVGTHYKKSGSQMQPSAISIHPKSEEIYTTKGTKPKLLIFDKHGSIKSVKPLSSKDFNQPEGISFSSSGQLFISNEGGKQPGNILQVTL